MRALGSIVLTGVCAVVVLVGVGAWISEPPTGPPRVTMGTPTPQAPEPDQTSSAFCAFVASPGVGSDFGATMAQSPDLDRRLVSLAAEWGVTGDEGARGQLLLECRRLGFLA